MKPFVLVGAGQFAEYVQFILEEQLGETVAAFAVNENYLGSGSPRKNSLPIVAYEKLQNMYSPMDYCVAIAFLGNDMFVSREKAFWECKSWGYQLPNIIHPSVVNQTIEMGVGNIVGAGTVFAPFTKIGNCNVFFDLSFMAHNTTAGDFNLLSTNVTPMGNCAIGSHCYIGGGSTINNKVVLANYTLVGANAFVKKNTKPYDVIVPAKGTTLEGKKSTDFNL